MRPTPNGSILQDDDDDAYMVLDAADEMEAKKVDPWEQQRKNWIASIPAQLGPGMATLSLLPIKQLERFEQLGRNSMKGKDPNFRKCDECEGKEKSKTISTSQGTILPTDENRRHDVVIWFC